MLGFGFSSLFRLLNLSYKLVLYLLFLTYNYLHNLNYFIIDVIFDVVIYTHACRPLCVCVCVCVLYYYIKKKLKSLVSNKKNVPYEILTSSFCDLL